ncbi:FTR1 family protein [Candidatus Woesearchaeota archaeon]|nr:FTR1 family protein [Candidatus Woesearchaeota archaeon]
MLTSFIITFRETLEVSLVVGIILSYLVKTKETKYNPVVYVGIVAGVIASLIGAMLFNKFANGFTGIHEQLFEGTLLLLGAFLLTTMILWMMQQKQVVAKMHEKLAEHLSKAQKFELFFLVFVAVLREGVETVIYLDAARYVAEESQLYGAILGIVAAIVLGYLLFVASVRVDIKKYFTVTSVLLILFAAGLVSHGVHEFEEVAESFEAEEAAQETATGQGTAVPESEEMSGEVLWNLNPAVNADGSYPLLHENGHVGAFLKELFGYNPAPTLAELLSYVGYILLVSFLWWRVEHKKE